MLITLIQIVSKDSELMAANFLDGFLFKNGRAS